MARLGAPISGHCRNKIRAGVQLALAAVCGSGMMNAEDREREIAVSIDDIRCVGRDV